MDPGSRKQGLLKVVPTAPAPARGAALHVPRDQRFRTGPEPPAARVAGRVGNIPFTVAPRDGGWFALATPPIATAVRFADPAVSVGLGTPKQLIGADGGVKPLRDVRQVLRFIRADPGVRVIATRRVRVAGRAGYAITATAREIPGAPAFCSSPCTPVFGQSGLTFTLSSDAISRMTVADVGGQMLLVDESGGPGGRGLAATGAWVATLRLG